jgi:hypothetical protein
MISSISFLNSFDFLNLFDLFDFLHFLDSLNPSIPYSFFIYLCLTLITSHMFPPIVKDATAPPVVRREFDLITTRLTKVAASPQTPHSARYPTYKQPS